MKNIILAFLLLGIPLVSFGETANVGLIQGIWFSQDTYYVGDTIRIYTAVQNNTGGDIEGEVDFFNNGELLGTKRFTSLDGRVTEVWMDTVATLGEHQFSVRIVELMQNNPGQESQSVTPRVIESENIIMVQHRPVPETTDDELSDTEIPENIPSWLATFLENLFGGKTEESFSEDESSAPSEPPTVTEPPAVREFGEQYPIVQKITRPINNLQNAVVVSTQNEQTRIQERRSLPSSDDTVNGGDDTSANNSWWLTLYSGVLWLIEKIFSSFVLVLLLVFGGIYLILKILFKIFGRRSAY